MTDRTHPDSGRATGAAHIIRFALELGLLWIDGSGRDKVREALDALDALEAQLEAIGAGGVSGPLMGRTDSKERAGRFTKKPVTIDAWLIDFGNKPLPDWVNEAFRTEAIDWCTSGEGVYINTLEGHMLGANGSWLIKGVQGELYACKPDIFAATYERASIAASAGSEPVALEPRHIRKFLQALQAGEMSVARAVEILDAWVKGRYSDDMVPPPPADSCLIADDEFPMEIVRKLRSEMATHPPQEGMVGGWTKASQQLPPCRDDQLYLGINTAGFAGVFNAVADIAGNVHCMYETPEETIDVMSSLDIWQSFTPPTTAAGSGKGG